MIRYPKDYNPIHEYWEKIQSGQEIVGKKIRVIFEKLNRDSLNATGEYYYSPSRANHVIEFIENFCRHSKGKMGGKPVILELWEKAIIAATFGFIGIDGNRQYREVILIVGKKNGKSLIASAVGLYLMVADSEAGADVYSVATKKDQAKIIWLEARRMVKKSPSLLKRIKPLVNEMVSDFNDGSFKPLASDSDTLDGLNVHGVLMDEIHQWKQGKALFDIMADGTSAREQPLIFITSTAGVIREDIYDTKYEEAERIIKGIEGIENYSDDNFLPFIYELDSREEWRDPKCWKKANPGLGTIKNLETLRKKVEKAKENPMLVKNLVCKEFNIRETSSESWLPFDVLKNETAYDLRELKPVYFFGGVDLSATTDLTCATALFKVKGDDNYYVKQMYWLPSDLFDTRIHEDKVKYDEYLQGGWLRLSAGNKINYKDIVAWFAELREEYGMYLYKCGYDSWSASYLVDELSDNYGKSNIEAVIQGPKTMSGPMKTIYAELKSKKINYDNNPLLRWNLSNAAIETDRNDNIALVKTSNPKRRIDGVASLIDAWVVMERNHEDYMNML